MKYLILSLLTISATFGLEVSGEKKQSLDLSNVLKGKFSKNTMSATYTKNGKSVSIVVNQGSNFKGLAMSYYAKGNIGETDVFSCEVEFKTNTNINILNPKDFHSGSGGKQPTVLSFIVSPEIQSSHIYQTISFKPTDNDIFMYEYLSSEVSKIECDYQEIPNKIDRLTYIAKKYSLDQDLAKEELEKYGFDLSTLENDDCFECM